MRARKTLAIVAGSVGVSLVSNLHAVDPFLFEGGDYTEVFDTLPNDASQIPPGLFGPGVFDVPQIDGTPLAGWQMRLTNGSASFQVEDGSSGAKNFVASLGSPLSINGLEDRALGVTDTTAVQHDMMIGVLLVNVSPNTYDKFTITYQGETWRHWDETRTQTDFPGPPGLQFSYAEGDETLDLLSPDAAFTRIQAIDFRPDDTPCCTANGGGVAIDGNAEGNNVIKGLDINFNNIIVEGLTWEPGEYLMLRWHNPNGGGNEDTLGIDDLVFSPIAIPEPAGLALLAIPALALFSRRRRS